MFFYDFLMVLCSWPTTVQNLRTRGTSFTFFLKHGAGHAQQVSLLSLLWHAINHVYDSRDLEESSQGSSTRTNVGLDCGFDCYDDARQDRKPF